VIIRQYGYEGGNISHPVVIWWWWFKGTWGIRGW